MNVILIIMDALRPDHLSINGYSRNTSPNIDKLEEEGTRFLNTYCTLPRTDPSPEVHNVQSVRTNKWKLIYNKTNKKRELYNVEQDKEEKNNLAGNNLEIEDQLWKELKKIDEEHDMIND